MTEALESMSVRDLLGYICAGIVVLSTFVQISPVKINPWSWLGKQIGKAINGDVMSRIDELQTEIRDVKAQQAKDTDIRDERHAEDCRTYIISFSDELRRSLDHSEEAFNRCFECIKDYKNYCDSHPNYINDKAVMSIKFIESKYQYCLDHNCFL